MKKFELYWGITLIIITTIIDVMFPFIVEYSASNLALICIISAMGYITAYLFIDSYLGKHEIHHYLRGIDDARSSIASQKGTIDLRKPRFDLSKNNK
jgi:hypothetical protein